MCVHIRFEYEVQMSDRKTQNWAGGIAQMTYFSLLRVLYFVVHIDGIVFLVLITSSWWRIEQRHKQVSILVVSLCLQHCQHQISAFDREQLSFFFFNCHTNLSVKISVKILKLALSESSPISRPGREIESAYKNVDIFHTYIFGMYRVVSCQGQCLQFSSPNSQTQWR